MEKKIVFQFTDLAYSDYADYVVCPHCGYEMLVPSGTDYCPMCGESDGCLQWADSDEQDVKIDDFCKEHIVHACDAFFNPERDCEGTHEVYEEFANNN